MFVKQITGPGKLLAAALNRALITHKRVIWLVPGGSNIPISVAAMNIINEKLSSKLVIMQTDERFVALESPDCNWHQLKLAGFDTKKAETYPALTENTGGLQQTASDYALTAQQQFERADYIFGQFGIGADGHIAGVLPNSVGVSSKALAVGYQTKEFGRITLTLEALKKVDRAMAFAYGATKASALQKVKDTKLTLNKLPSRVLWDIKVSTVYNDQIEG